MKLKILVKLIEKMLGVTVTGNEPRADMYLPEKLLAMSLVFTAGGVGFGVFAVLRFEIWAVALAVFGLVFGIAALLCWRNQTIHVISDEEFVYSTMFGKKQTFRFSDIQGLIRNKDSLTLFVAGKKIHIESMAVLSERLVNLINEQLQKSN